MSAKREQVLWSSVWAVSRELEKVFSLKAICSVGVYLFSQLTADEQKEYIAAAKEAHNLAEAMKAQSAGKKQKRGASRAKPA